MRTLSRPPYFDYMGNIFRALYSLLRISDNIVYLNALTRKRKLYLQTERIPISTI